MGVSSPQAHGHASLGPSSAARWTACPGSVARSAGYHSPDSEASRRGTRGHALAEAALRFYFEGADFGDAVEQWHREYPDAEDFVELCGVADEYVAVVRDLVRDLGEGTRVLIEERVVVPGTEEHVWGTADCIVVNTRLGVLHVCDYKAGKGVRVEARDNLQLRLYALGALNAIGPDADKVDGVWLHIVQPAFDGELVDSMTTSDLRVFQGWVSAKVEAALDPAAPVRPGEAQCRWCPVRDSCPEHLDWRIRDWFGSSGLEPAPPSPGLDELDLRRHLEARDRAARYVRAVDEAARANADHLPSGWEARTTRRTRVCKPAVLADRLTRAGYEPLETRVKSLSRLRREVGPGLDLLAGDALEVTESISVRACAEG